MDLKNAYALLIGVGADLPVTVKDATAIGAVLVNPEKAAYKPENVVILTEQDATRENVLRELKNLVQKTEKTDEATVIVYYSGHGGQYQNEASSDYYLLTHGYDPSNRDGTMVRGDEFSRLIDQIKAKKLLVMIDCCHAAGIIGQPLLKLKSPDSGIVNSNIELLRQLNTGEGKVFITSCDDDEQSVILPNSENSLFTEVILESLEGKASGGEEFVRVIELLYYVLTQVPKRIKPFNHTQRPIINKIEFLSPDYYICKAATKQYELSSTAIKDFAKVKELITTHDISNSHDSIAINSLEQTPNLGAQTKAEYEAYQKNIIDYLIKGNTKKAIAEFLELTKKYSTDQRKSSILIAARYNNLFEEKHKGTISDSDYKANLARINDSLQYFLDECEWP